MQKVYLFAAVLGLAVFALSSCTVVEPTPATTSTTVHRETTVAAPVGTATTTTRTTGGY